MLFWRKWILVFGLLLALGVVCLWRIRLKDDPVAQEVRNAIVTLQFPLSVGEQSRNGEQRLLGLGERAYPELRRIIRWRRSRLSAVRSMAWGVLPERIRRGRAAPDNATEVLQIRLEDKLFGLGPSVCRGTAGAICDALDGRDSQRDGRALLLALSWSVPESPRATLVFTNCLSRVSGLPLFIGRTAEEFWPRVPQFVPVLASCLTNAEMVTEAAFGLGLLGTNANVAVSLLAQSAEHGVAGEPPNLTFRRTMAPLRDALSHNRVYSLQALARIGITNSAVVQAVHRCADADDRATAQEAALTALALQIPIEGRLSEALDRWQCDARTDQARLESNGRLARLGQLREKARAAVPLLKRVANGEAIQLPERNGSAESRASQQLQFTAVGCLVRIDPEQARPFLSLLLTNFGSWDAAETLREWSSAKDEIVPFLKDKLSRRSQRDIAAYVVGSFEPDNLAVRRILEEAAQNDGWGPFTQGMALGRLWRATHDAAAVLPSARTLLANGTDQNKQQVISVLSEMGSSARPLVPELKRLLTADFWAVRDRAGELLRKLAPEEMPPLVD